MNRILISLALITFLVGFAGALDFYGGVELLPGERAAMERFEHGFETPWAGGEPPHGPLFDQVHPQLRSIKRLGFPFTGRHWPGVQISLFRACHPFCDCDGSFCRSRSYFSGWRFQE
jgi:hypothetical protein